MLSRIRSHQISFRPHLLRKRNTWLVIFSFAFLIAAAIAAWPSVQCALGQGSCGVKAAWCAADCTYTCQSSTRLGHVESCTGPVSNICRDRFLARSSAVRCSSSSTCNVTTVVSGYDGLSFRNSHSYWNVQRCERTPVNGKCADPIKRDTRVTCCVGSTAPTPGPGPGPGPCTPSYDAPTVTLAGVTPPFPIVFGQDPDELGFDATVIAVGGLENSDCDNGPAQQALSSLNLDFLALSDESVNWIEYDLAQFYPGARVKDYYPYHPNFQVIINGVNGSLVFHHDPLDPGLYDIHVTAVQDDGQQTTVVFHIPAYLLEATIIHP